MDLSKKSEKEIIDLYIECVSELKKRGIARTNAITGELGEHIVCEYYAKNSSLPKLSLVDPGIQGYDAYDRKGKRYSIKTCTGLTTGGFFSLNDKGVQIIKNQEFDYVVICKMTNDFKLEAIYELNWDTFIEHKKWAKSIGTWNLTLTKKLLNDVKIIYKK